MSRKPKPASEPARTELKEEAGRYAAEAVLALVELMRNSGSDPVRVAAARELLDRAHGKPKAESDKAEGISLQEMVRQAFEREDP
jgi:hypothetical protein